jgi:protein transport protein SEC61 subunit gamma and related proteins
MEEQNTASWKYRIKHFFAECVRVFKITKKPTGTEFKTIVKVSGLGILLIGMIGFVVQMIRLTFF